MKPALSLHLGQLLHSLSAAFELRTLEKCRERGHRKFRCSHSAVIAHLDSAGLCLGELAERIGISQQATGKLVRDLERAGYLESHTDAHDKRSRIIQLTPAGAVLQADIKEVLLEVRSEFEAILGGGGLQSFEQQLRDATNALIDPTNPG
ncbi:MAG TPA: MarR family winged helix-turn-helix transcriptional regulator [Spongiibacteraceae bacterium]|nr:MarR family winged helix-turn-helix transcriptional regulator [Spongiibacteraceae bacterium]